MTMKPWPQRAKRNAPEDVEFDIPVRELLPAPVQTITTMQADCCVANAAYLVVLPATRDRLREGELLLCGHHFGAGREGLRRIKTIAFDANHRLCAISE